MILINYVQTYQLAVQLLLSYYLGVVCIAVEALHLQARFQTTRIYDSRVILFITRLLDQSVVDMS